MCFLWLLRKFHFVVRFSSLVSETKSLSTLAPFNYSTIYNWVNGVRNFTSFVDCLFRVIDYKTLKTENNKTLSWAFSFVSSHLRRLRKLRNFHFQLSSIVHGYLSRWLIQIEIRSQDHSSLSREKWTIEI